MKRFILVAATVTLVVGPYIHFRPVRYEHRGLKYVEYRNGHTCSYFPYDNWEQLPLICGDTAVVRKMNGRQP